MSWTPPRRVGLIVGAAVVVVLVLLLAIGLGDDGGGDGSPTPATSTSRPLATTAAGPRLPAAARTVEGSVFGAAVRLEVQPLVRAGTATVLTALLTVVEAPSGGSLTIGDAFTARGDTSNRRYSLSDVRLFAPEVGSPARAADGEATTSLSSAPSIKRGEAAGLRVVFGALPPAATSADVLWPLLGVIQGLPIEDGPVPTLPGFGAAPARDVALAGVIGEVRPVTARSSELEGAVRVDQAPVQTKVVLAADVGSALDRADLSPQANAALARAAAAIQAAGPAR